MARLLGGSLLLSRPYAASAAAACPALVFLLRRSSGARRLTRLMMANALVLAVRLVYPLSSVLVLERVRRLARALLRPNGGRALWLLLRRGLMVWALAEFLFYLYIVRYYNFLNRPSHKKWRAVSIHSSPERRLASMERYLSLITQIVRGGAFNGADVPTRVQSTTITSLKRASFSGMNGLRRSHSGSRSNESVDDLLRLYDESSDRNTSGNIPEEDVLRLKYLEICGWFSGAGCGDRENPHKWLKRGNVEEWISFYWFRGRHAAELNRAERAELLKLTDKALGHMGLQDLPSGKATDVEPVRITSDPLIYLHRPLMLYVGTAVIVPLLTKQVMLRLGFVREHIGGLCYWHRGPRAGVPAASDLAGPKQVPLVFIHGLGVGLVPYFYFLHRLSQNFSDNMYVPELPFLASRPYETVPSSREVVAQLQDMLAANGHTAAHFVGHSFGSVVVGWMLKRSPSSILYMTLMEPAIFVMMKVDAFTKMLYGAPVTSLEKLYRYFVFRELFTVNLLCRNFFWEQNTVWPEELRVPTVIELAEDDAIVHSRSVRRLIEYEQATRARARKPLQKSRPSGSSVDIRRSMGSELSAKATENVEAPLDIMWCDGFFHGMILGHNKAIDNLFAKMRKVVEC